MSPLMLALYINIGLFVALLGLQPVWRTIIHGPGFALSSLDEKKTDSVFQERLHRVKNNQLETMMLLAPIILVAELGNTPIAQAGMIAALLIASRSAYLLFALGGIPFLRSASWLVGFVAWGYLALQLIS